MKLFPLIKEIKNKAGELHFRRWKIIQTKWFSVYLHGIYKADEEAHLHNHPWNYTSIVLYGDFFEGFIQDGEYAVKLMKPFSISRQKYYRYHKIHTLFTNKVFTLFFVGKRHKQEWGYDVDGELVSHIIYRKMKNNV